MKITADRGAGKSAHAGTSPQADTGRDINPFTVIRAILRAKLPSGLVRVLQAIADRAGHGRSTCTASYQTLAEDAGLSRRQIIKSVQRLAEAGWIRVESVHANDAGNRITLGPTLEEQIRVQADRERGPRGQSARRLRVIQASPEGPALVNSRASAGESQDTSASEVRDTSASEVQFTQTSSSTDPSTSPSNEGAKNDDDVRFADGGKKTQETEPEVPAEVLTAIKAQLGESDADEVSRNPRQFHTACGGNWECVSAAARYVGSAKRKDKRVRSSIGMLDGKTREFAHRGIPKQFQPPPPPPPPPDPRLMAISEDTIRATTRSVIGQALLMRVDWPEIIADIQARLKARDAELGLTAEESSQRLAWAMSEVDNWRARQKANEEAMARFHGNFVATPGKRPGAAASLMQGKAVGQ